MGSEVQDLLVGMALAVPVTILMTLVALLAYRRIQRRRAMHTLMGGNEPAADTEGDVVENMETSSLSRADQANMRSVLQRRIESAQARDDKAAAASHHLELARIEAALGNEPAQLASLRAAAGLASLHGAHAVHAAARIGLAEIAARSGDLTTACEHWQLARVALADDGNTERAAKIDKLMRENGCPTDWVLTDF